MNIVLSIFVLEFVLCLIGFCFFVFDIMNIHIYNLFYICTLACMWALFLKINFFVFVFYQPDIAMSRGFAREITAMKMGEKRHRGRPRLRWMDREPEWSE